MRISLIAAADKQLGIGADNRLIWHLPDDFKWFKKHTLGKPVLMGRNTMVSLGKALPGRQNLVLSSSSKDILEGFLHVSSIDEAINALPVDTEELMVIGGGSVYRQMLPMAHRILLTRVDHEFPEMDTFFPEWDASEWEETHREHHDQDEKHAYAFDMLILDRLY